MNFFMKTIAADIQPGDSIQYRQAKRWSNHYRVDEITDISNLNIAAGRIIIKSKTRKMIMLHSNDTVRIFRTPAVIA